MSMSKWLGWGFAVVAMWGCASTKNDPPNVARMRQGCEAGRPGACSALGRALEEGKLVGKDTAAAGKLFRRACEAGEPSACNSLGLQHMHATAGSAEKRKAFDLFERGCTLGGAAACHNFAIHLMRGDVIPTDIPKGLQMLTQACNSSYGKACFDLGAAVLKGGNARLAQRFFEKSCMLGEPAGCNIATRPRPPLPAP